MIEFVKVSYQYAPSLPESIHEISLKVDKGECVLITGKSGCGKTTLTRCINGLIKEYEEGVLTGQVIIAGREIGQLEIYEISEIVASVFQDPRSQFFTTNTSTEVAFGCENLGVPYNEMVQRVDNAFEDLNAAHLKGRDIFSLSSGEKQKIALSSVYAMHPTILVLDEPSSNLDPKSTIELSLLLKKLKAAGHTIVICEHRLHYLANVIDRMLYMEQGQIKRSYSCNEIRSLSEQDRDAMGIRDFFLDGISLPERTSVSKGKAALTLAHVSADAGPCKNLIADVSFCMEAGEIAGLVGENGVGKTTLAKVICGLFQESSGEILIQNNALGNKRRIQESYFVMQDMDYQLFTETVEKELRLGCPKGETTDRQTEKAISTMDLGDIRERHPASLSGGQKQRVTIAASLVKGSSLVVLDEPTSGLDGRNMQRVVQMLKDLSSQGKTMLVISHDYEFLVSVCHRILELRDGRIKSDFLLNTQSVMKLKETLLHTS